MSIFSRILDKLRGHAQAAPASDAGTAVAPPQSPGPTDDLPAAGSASAAAPVDVTGILDGLLAQQRQKLDWRHSIVDLMKLLELDSSLENRKELAKELNYTGDTNDSAKMNVWLHQQVMRKLAENGGKVPAELKD
ncbi:DUF3597 domain-containing protein [Belnapia rosea]|uniref:DUF3597 domain-containing protein n=1 Tax=Belnapia rosea TaxID=938405 RepID=A0A1G6LAP5_9PROT|nr:DUF3597 domain-containing protein [Belnapia rosea]SDB49464.1 protein of unknown function [Belnapia rosea]SDC40350.1 protein of unknown function [Belnapia rosea]